MTRPHVGRSIWLQKNPMASDGPMTMIGWFYLVGLGIGLTATIVPSKMNIG